MLAESNENTNKNFRLKRIKKPPVVLTDGLTINLCESEPEGFYCLNLVLCSPFHSGLGPAVWIVW
jgi:hypothetical protein